MKGYTNFMAGFLGPKALGKVPGRMKYMDWKKVDEVIAAHPTATIYAGLREDWSYTSGVIYSNGTYYDGGCLYCESSWATPIVDIEGKEFECWTYDGGESGMPEWWKDGKVIHSVFDFDWGSE